MMDLLDAILANMKKDILRGLAVVSVTAMLLAIFFFALAASQGGRTDSIGYRRAKAERVYRVAQVCPCNCSCKWCVCSERIVEVRP